MYARVEAWALTEHWIDSILVRKLVDDNIVRKGHD